MPDPFCRQLPLQTGVKLIAVISFVWTLVLIVLEIVLVYKKGLTGVGVLNPEFADAGILSSPGNGSGSALAAPSPTPTPRRAFSIPLSDVTMSSIWLVSWVLDVVFCYVLWRGAVMRSVALCILWFYVRCAFLIFRIVFLGIYLLAGYSILTKIPVLLLLLFRVYSLWAVNRFIGLLQAEAALKTLPIPHVVVQYEDDNGALHERKPSTQSEKDKAEAAPAAGQEEEGHENPLFHHAK